jgi:tetratricopeptide (TPR) repeat protein
VGKIRAKRKAIWIVGIAVVAILCGLCAALILRPSDPIAEAKAAYRRGDWSQAARIARERLLVDRDNLDAIRQLARANARLGNDDSAVALYQNRLGIDRMEAEDRLLLGLMIERQGDRAMALDVWHKAAGEHPDSPELLEAVARVSSQMGRPEVAAEAAMKLREFPSWEARGQILLGLARSAMDDDAGAAEALGRGMSLDASAETSSTTNAQARKVLARSLLRLGRPSEAVAAFGNAKPAATDLEGAWLTSRADLALGLNPDRTEGLLERVEAYRKAHPLMPEPGPYLGSARCAECHGEISSSYQKSRHARTFSRGDELLDLPRPEAPLADPDRAGATHLIERDENRLRVTSSEGDKAYRLLVDFAFGTPERYLTMVGRDEKGTYRALRLSHYHDAKGSGWARTSGDVGDSAHSADIRGQDIHTRDGVVRCLGCHVTNPRDFRFDGKEPSAAANDRAIGCERCHGPGSSHVAAVKLESLDSAIVNAGRTTARAVNEQCRECHVVGDASEIALTPADPRWVRSAGLTLTFSRCFIRSTGKLDCLTCHDPHSDSPTTAAAYEPKCLGCHSSSAEETNRVVCKVSPAKGCIGCHMPKRPVADIHGELTDHFIRTYQEGPAPR